MGERNSFSDIRCSVVVLFYNFCILVIIQNYSIETKNRRREEREEEEERDFFAKREKKKKKKKDLKMMKMHQTYLYEMR